MSPGEGFCCPAGVDTAHHELSLGKVQQGKKEPETQVKMGSCSEPLHGPVIMDPGDPYEGDGLSTAQAGWVQGPRPQYILGTLGCLLALL